MRNEAIRGVVQVSSLSLGRRLQNYGGFFLAAGHWKESIPPPRDEQMHTDFYREFMVSGAPLPRRWKPAHVPRPMIALKDQWFCDPSEEPVTLISRSL